MEQTNKLLSYLTNNGVNVINSGNSIHIHYMGVRYEIVKSNEFEIYFVDSRGNMDKIYCTADLQTALLIMTFDYFNTHFNEKLSFAVSSQTNQLCRDMEIDQIQNEVFKNFSNVLSVDYLEPYKVCLLSEGDNKILGFATNTNFYVVKMEKSNKDIYLRTLEMAQLYTYLNEKLDDLYEKCGIKKEECYDFIVSFMLNNREIIEEKSLSL